MDQHVKLATQIITNAQNEAERELSNEERRNMLKEKFSNWSAEYIRKIVGQLGDCV